jgi:GYF domain 2
MFRPYNLTSLTAWTVGSLAGNYAYYSTKERQNVERAAGELKDDYLQYKEFGGELSVENWLHEKFHINNQLSPKEVAVRTMVLEFQGRKLSMEERVMFVMSHLNFVWDINNPQCKAFKNLPYNWLDNETLFQLWEAFFNQLLEDGLSKDDAFQKSFGFVGVKIGTSRLKEFGEYLTFTLRERHEAEAEFKAKTSAKSKPVTKTKPTTAKEPRRLHYFKELYIARGQKTMGPYTYPQMLEQLKNGTVSEEDLVAYDGATEWIKFKQLITELNSEQ